MISTAAAAAAAAAAHLDRGRHDTDLWLAARRCLEITASEFAAIMGESKFTTREKLMDTKLGLAPRFNGNAGTAWGLRVEPHAVKQYVQVTGFQVEETGLFTDESCILGASPDGLVTETFENGTMSEGLLEVKCAFGRRNQKEVRRSACCVLAWRGVAWRGVRPPHWQANPLAPHPRPCPSLQLKPFDNCPRRFYDQIQGQMELADRDWCDLMVWIPKNSRRPNYTIVRVHRNREYWTTKLAPALAEFREELEEEKRTRLVV